VHGWLDINDDQDSSSTARYLTEELIRRIFTYFPKASQMPSMSLTNYRHHIQNKTQSRSKAFLKGTLQLSLKTIIATSSRTCLSSLLLLKNLLPSLGNIESILDSNDHTKTIQKFLERLAILLKQSTDDLLRAQSDREKAVLRKIICVLLDASSEVLPNDAKRIPAYGECNRLFVEGEALIESKHWVSYHKINGRILWQGYEDFINLTKQILKRGTYFSIYVDFFSQHLGDLSARQNAMLLHTVTCAFQESNNVSRLSAIMFLLGEDDVGQSTCNRLGIVYSILPTLECT
jgi:hypothetical protein